MAPLSRNQQLALWLVAAIIGLTLADVVGAGVLGSIGLVAGVGIVIGFACGAWLARNPR